MLGRVRLGNERLWLSSTALEVMAAEAITWAPRETGGAIMGYESEDGLVVTDLIPAGPEAQRETARFAPDAGYQLEAIGEIYNASGRLHTYIGDWHTHPGGWPMHSSTDRAALREISRSPGARCSRPLMVILGEREEWSAVAWRFVQGRWWGRIEAMTIELY